MEQSNTLQMSGLIGRLFLFSTFLVLGRQSIAGPIYSIVDLGTLGGSRMTAWSVTNIGVVAGYGTTAAGDTSAFIYESGVLYSIGAGGNTLDSKAYGVNGAGQAAVNANTPGGGNAYVYDNGVLTQLPGLGGATTTAIAINASGQMAGMAATGSGAARAFLLSAANLQSLGTLAGGNWSAAYGINDAGTVVGYSDTASGAFHGFVWTAGGGMADIGTLGGANSYAMNVSASGVVTGHAQTSSGYLHAFAMSGGVLQDLGTLGGGNSFAYGINSKGTVVGYSGTAGGDRAFVYSAGRMWNLNGQLAGSPGWTLTNAYGVNDSGQIVGSGLYFGQEHAFLLNPVAVTAPSNSQASTPEPDTFLLTGGALCLVSLLLRKRVPRLNPEPGAEHESAPIE